MTQPCMCDCGFSTAEGVMCLDWEAVAMEPVCAVAQGISGTFQNSPNWAVQADHWLEWQNTTCRAHVVLAALDQPYVTMKVAGGNAWQVRGYIDHVINGAAPPVDTTRDPELQWSTNWYAAMPAGTDQEQRAPGYAERAFMVAPGDTLLVGFRFFARTVNYTAAAVNFLEIANYHVSLSAWPAKTPAASGRIC